MDAHQALVKGSEQKEMQVSTDRVHTLLDPTALAKLVSLWEDRIQGWPIRFPVLGAWSRACNV